MSNLNKVFLMGRLTRDPELRYTPQGVPVSEIGLAINREFGGGGEGERRKEVTFVDVTLWRRHAELVCQYMKKGSPILIEGRLSYDTWQTQDGQRRSRLRVVAENFQFIGTRSEGSRGGDSQYTDYEPGSGGEEPVASNERGWQGNTRSSTTDSGPALDESEIPF